MSEPTLNLGQAHEAALASITTPSTPAPAAPAPTPDTPPQTATPTPTPQAPDLNAAPPSDAPVNPYLGTKHRIKVRGEEQEVDYDELLKGYSRNADYTRSKMELAEYRKSAEAQVQQAIAEAQGQVEQYRQFLNTPEKLFAYAERVRAYLQSQGKLPQQLPVQADPNADAGDPNDIATIDQVRKMTTAELARLQADIQAQRTQVSSEIRQEIERAQQELVRTQEVAAHNAEFKSVIDQTLQRLPQLQLANPQAENVLRWHVFQQNPATAQEAKDLLVQAAEQWAAALDEHYTNEQKKRAVTRQGLETRNIEPAGGAGPQPTPKALKFGSADLSKAAEAYVATLAQRQ